MLSAIREQIIAQRDRWIFFLPVPLGLGIVFYFQLMVEPPFYAGILLLAGSLCFLPASRRHEAAFVVWCAVFMFALGLVAAQVRTMYLDAPVLSRESYAMTVGGRVVEVDALPKSYRMTLDNVDIIDGPYFRDPVPERVRIRLKNNDPTVPQAGDIVDIRAVLTPLSAPVAPDAFDFQRHAFFRQLGGTGYAVGDVQIRQPHARGFFFENLRHYIRTRVDTGIENRDYAAITTALLVGESRGISAPAWDVIRISGIAHLIAISGSHITLVAGFVFFLMRGMMAASPYVALRFPVKKIAAVCAMAGVVFYMLLIASPIPAQRAVIMMCVVMTAVILDRDPFTLRLAAFAALVLFLCQPESLVGPSFQLSFSAVVALIAFYEVTREWWARQVIGRPWYRRYAIYLLGCFVTTVIATTATAPYALYHFGRVPTLSALVTNMVAVPVSSFMTLPFGIIACFLMPFDLQAIPLKLTEISVDIIMKTAHETASWPYATVQVDAWPEIWMGVMTAGGLWLLLWRGWIRWLGLVPVAMAVATLPFTPRADVLVSSDMKIYAVRAPDDGTLYISNMRRARFVREKWIEREGSRGFAVIPKNADTDYLQCHDERCLYTVRGYRVAFVPDAAAAIDMACKADVFVIPQYHDGMNPCPRADLIDRNYARRFGAHAIYIGQGTAEIKTVNETRGRRPWTGAAPPFVNPRFIRKPL